ncbi:Retinol Dehydrogenase 14 [Manis pentadactyla]|nr:Retinol Dehydrogenase 14 [Manis pentadactyla]
MTDVEAVMARHFRVNGVIVYINVKERTSLGLSLGSSSDVPFRCSLSCTEFESDTDEGDGQIELQVYISAQILDAEADGVSFRLDLSRCEGECMIEFEDKAEIWVTSKMKVMFGSWGCPGQDSISCKTLKLTYAAQGDYTIQFQDYCEPRLISKVMEEFQEQVHARLSLCIHFGMTDVEVDGVISETLALRKELGSGSDVKGEQDGGSGFWNRARFWILPDVRRSQTDLDHHAETLALRKELGSGSDEGEQDGGSGFGEAWVTSMFLLDFRSTRCEGECMIEFEDKAEIWVTSKMKVKVRDPARARDSISCKVFETLALRKELGSGSDVKGRAKMVDQGFETLALRKELGYGSDERESKMVYQALGDCAIQFQDYSEARVISMMTVEFQATVRR